MGTYQYYARLNTEQTDLVHSRRRLPKDTPPPLETDVLVEALDEDIYDHAREKENLAGYVAKNIHVSPDHELMAIVMQNRRETFMQIRNLTSSEDLLALPIKVSACVEHVAVRWGTAAAAAVNDTASLFTAR